MKITDIICYKTDGLFYVKVETDEGVSGFGESSPMRPDVLAQIMTTVVKPQVIGMDPFDGELIEERVMRKNYKISGQMLASTFSGLEIALWDLKGRYLKQRVYNLLGGLYRNRIPLYASSMSRDLTHEEEADKVRDAISRLGVKAVKIKVGPRYGTGLPVDLADDEKKVKAAREAIGPDCRLMIDGNSSYTYIQAVQLFERIKQYDIHHFEEPCPYFDIETYVKLAHTLPVPIHVGEQDWNLFTFRDFISRGACHLYAADPVKCGGLSSAKRAAALCRAFGIHYVPHNTTRGVGFAAALHLAASSPECSSYYEYNIEKSTTRERYLKEPFRVENGYIVVPEGHGLGIELDEEKMEATLDVVR
ncbi:mandelate racemase/muconate lactonizing enzyme family protein [Paenibacillus thalictri]|uniref:mandelate racemase/muconate lactonizing enzyme family protein n=1 Tax=Paenibacillus thalictri TaxID=2527873 RepID=UPI0013EF3384|nr:mandelate racemase/muconate lactonizing enzyme family protein [Paenibacillus thalictri]